MKGRRPRLYRELKAAGRLKEHCQEREQQALERHRRLMQSGAMNEDQADELVRVDLLGQ